MTNPTTIPGGRMRVAAISLFVAIAGGVSAGYALRPNASDVIAHVGASATQFDFGETRNEWRLGAPLEGQLLQTQGGELSILDANGDRMADSGDLDSITAADLWLDRIIVLPDTRLEWQRAGDRCLALRLVDEQGVASQGMRLEFRARELAGLTINGAEQAVAPTANVSVASITWTAQQPHTSVVFCPQEKLQVVASQLEEVSFVTQLVQSETDSRVVSAVQNGHLRFPSVDRLVQLAPFDFLRLTRLESDSGARIEFDPAAGLVNLTFIGRTGGTIMGVPARPRDARPNFLEALARSQGAVSIIGAITLLWGFLWSAVNLLRTR